VPPVKPAGWQCYAVSYEIVIHIHIIKVAKLLKPPECKVRWKNASGTDLLQVQYSMTRNIPLQVTAQAESQRTVRG
jgi:hypothetical protein